MDVRYVRNDGTAAPLNLATELQYYSRDLTKEMFNLFAASGQVTLIDERAATRWATT